MGVEQHYAPWQQYGPPPLRQALPVAVEFGLYGGAARGFEAMGRSILDAWQSLSHLKKVSLGEAIRRDPSPAIQLYSIAPGALAGLEEAEDGSLTFDPEKAILGIAAAGVGTAVAARIGITKRGVGGRFMRGKKRGKHPVLQMADVIDESRFSDLRQSRGFTHD
jgi:hypothetical protein